MSIKCLSGKIVAILISKSPNNSVDRYISPVEYNNKQSKQLKVDLGL